MALNIGVLTSGGDSPGMNASVRAVVRAGIERGSKVIGIRRGFAGMIDGDFQELGLSSVGGIIQRGGTILMSARCEEFKTREGQEIAVANLKKNNIDAVVVVGGDGSFHGARVLSVDFDIPTIGLPGTIDNDIAGTDFTIGFDTAVNMATRQVNRLRDTAVSHKRAYFVEVMGRHAGYIALETALATGAEEVLIPEMPVNIDELAESLVKTKKSGKPHCLIVFAEGAGDIWEVSRQIKEKIGLEASVITLGHLQRGGSPTHIDRMIASRMGAYAVDLILDGKTALMVGIKGNDLVTQDISKAWKYRKKFSLDAYNLAKKLA